MGSDRLRWFNMGRSSPSVGRVALFGVALAAALPGGGCRRETPDNGLPTVIASNTYLQAVVEDVAPRRFNLVCLAPPGTCPGHFDLQPRQLDAFREARVMLRFAFQAGLEERVSGVARDALEIGQVQTRGSLNEPESYATACRQVAEVLVAAELVDEADVNRRLAEIEARLDALGTWCREQLATVDAASAIVVTSQHQASFCEWLGLRVAGTFTTSDTMQVREIDTAVRDGAGATLIIANRPEGRRLADAIADRLGAGVIVFDNFPSGDGDGPAFDAMVRENVRRLCGVLSHE